MLEVRFRSDCGGEEGGRAACEATAPVRTTYLGLSVDVSKTSRQLDIVGLVPRVQTSLSMYESKTFRHLDIVGVVPRVHTSYALPCHGDSLATFRDS